MIDLKQKWIGKVVFPFIFFDLKVEGDILFMKSEESRDLFNVKRNKDSKLFIIRHVINKK